MRRLLSWEEEEEEEGSCKQKARSKTTAKARAKLILPRILYIFFTCCCCLRSVRYLIQIQRKKRKRKPCLLAVTLSLLQAEREREREKKKKENSSSFPFFLFWRSTAVAAAAAAAAADYCFSGLVSLLRPRRRLFIIDEGVEETVDSAHDHIQTAFTTITIAPPSDDPTRPDPTDVSYKKTFKRSQPAAKVVIFATDATARWTQEEKEGSAVVAPLR